MAEIGTAASIIQLIGALSKGLTTLRNAYVAIRDVRKRIEEILFRVTSLAVPIQYIQHYIQSRSANVQSELHDVIGDVTTSCLVSLRIIQEKLPVVGTLTRRMETAVRMWMIDREIEEASKHIDGSLQNLRLILQVLNMYVPAFDYSILRKG